MKKPKLTKEERQLLSKLTAEELRELQANGGKAGHLNVPIDLVNRLVELSDVAFSSLSPRKGPSTPWEATTPGMKRQAAPPRLPVTDDPLEALKAVPVSTSFSFVEDDEPQKQGLSIEPEPAKEESLEILVGTPVTEAVAEANESTQPDAPASYGEIKAVPHDYEIKVAAAPPGTTPRPSEAIPSIDFSVSAETTDSTLAPDTSPGEDETGPQGSSFVKRITRLFSRRKFGRFLHELEVFQGIGQDAISQIARRVEEREFKKGATIIRRGDVGDCMYILAEGEVRIPISDRKTQQQYSITLSPGQIFGEMALLTGERRNADVYATTACHCLLLHKKDVDELIARQPEIGKLLTTILGKRFMQSGQMKEVADYQLLGQLGKGGMAFVFEAVHKKRERNVVAMKMLSHALVYQGDFAERFRMEAKVLADLRHPHIVDFIDIQEAYATFFIIMEKLSGVDLNQRIERGGTFSFTQTREIIVQVASALAFAHDHGIIHRDIKPSNIMFTEAGKVKVGDFGLALQQEKEEGGVEGAKSKIEGTPTYMAPEQIMRQPLDRRVDIYALGIVAYKMLVGRPPFRGKLQEVLNAHLNTPLPSLKQQLPGIPRGLESFIEKSTAKSPDERFQSAHEILEHFGAQEQQEALPKLGVETLTFVFSPDQSEQVRALIRECMRKASDYPGIQIHSSS